MARTKKLKADKVIKRALYSLLIEKSEGDLNIQMVMSEQVINQITLPKDSLEEFAEFINSQLKKT